MEIIQFRHIGDSAIFVRPNFTAADRKKNEEALLRLYSDCQRAHGKYIKVGGRALHIATNARHRSPERSVKLFSPTDEVLFSHCVTDFDLKGQPKGHKGKLASQKAAWTVLAKILDIDKAGITFAELKHSLPNISAEILHKEIVGLRYLTYIHVVDELIILAGNGAERAYELGFTTRAQRVRAVKGQA
jgi:hypothetical protein